MGNQEYTGINGRSSLKEKIFKAASQFAVPSRIEMGDAWGAIEPRIIIGRQVRFDFALFARIAASLLIPAISTYVIYHYNEVELLTGRGAHQLVELPDHSTVLLNAGSVIRYNSMLFPVLRKVYFDGEAYFSVRKGSRFRVISNQGIVEVLGTQFNVMTRGDKFEVACTEGKIAVTSTNNQSPVLLTAGLKTFLSGNVLKEPFMFNPENTSWTKGEFYFENSSLTDVLNALSLQYDISIQSDVENQSSRFYTGYFRNDNLAEALELICAPLGLQYKILNTTQVEITSANN